MPATSKLTACRYDVSGRINNQQLKFRQALHVICKAANEPPLLF